MCTIRTVQCSVALRLVGGFGSANQQFNLVFYHIPVFV